MNIEGKKIGFVMTGSFCTFKKTIDELKKIVEADDVSAFMTITDVSEIVGQHIKSKEKLNTSE